MLSKKIQGPSLSGILPMSIPHRSHGPLGFGCQGSLHFTKDQASIAAAQRVQDLQELLGLADGTCMTKIHDNHHTQTIIQLLYKYSL